MLFIALLLAAEPPTPALERQFETAVRPLFVDRCQTCHGAAKQNGGLRLDAPQHLLKGGDSGPAIVRGRPDDSLLIKAVRRHPDVSAMPPHEKLPAPSVRALEDWIRSGAVWPNTAAAVGLGDKAAINAAAKTHWALQPVKAPPPPNVKNSMWCYSSFDHFVLAKLEAVGLEPPTDADRTTLLRRVYFDLIGLPPTPADVESFAADPDPTQAAFAKVVDRLLASPRYGERWGRHWLDVARYADTKGYVFQEERRYPFSYTYRDWVIRAVNEDLPYDRFVRYQIAADKLVEKNDPDLAAMGFLTVGRRFLQDVHEIADDRIDVVTRGVLGLTVSCARCHDHKYDPISMEDYYGLYGVFASSEEPKDLPVLTSAGGKEQQADFEKRMKQKTDAVVEFLGEQHGAVERKLVDDAEKLLRLSLQSNQGSPRKIGESARQVGLSPGAFRRWSERWNERVAAAKKSHDPALALWIAGADLPENEFPKQMSLRLEKVRNAKAKPIPPSLASRLQKPMTKREDLAVVYAGFIREASESLKAGEEHPSLFGVAGAFKAPQQDVQQYFDRRQGERFKALEREVEELKVQHPGAEARAMVMVDRGRPVEPRVFLRGNPGRQGPPAPRAVPAVLAGAGRKPFRDGSGRRELADALVDPSNPLTARVIVNRVFQWRFGKGLASSPSDFGLRSEPPTHPQLLDHLASEFVANGWSMKSLHRRMLLSHFCQSSSVADEKRRKLDPDNKLLSRFPRLRHEWEALRDSVLAVSGRLESRMGGRPVSLFANPHSRRRTVYGFIDRQNLDAPFRTFDFATPDATSPLRFVTTVPQQGLYLLNSRFLLEESEAFATRPEFAAAEPRQRAERMMRWAFGRSPQSTEIDAAVNYLSSQPDWKSNPAAVWKRFAQAMFISNEFAFVD